MGRICEGAGREEGRRDKNDSRSPFACCLDFPGRDGRNAVGCSMSGNVCRDLGD